MRDIILTTLYIHLLGCQTTSNHALGTGRQVTAGHTLDPEADLRTGHPGKTVSNYGSLEIHYNYYNLFMDYSSLMET